jgi:ABC-type dipeptide/oligopeptide/nickel transport system permease component
MQITAASVTEKIFRVSGLLSFLMRRLLSGLPVLFAITLVSFLMIRAIPGGPFVAAGQRAATPELIAALEHHYGLNRPLLLNLPSGDDWRLLHWVDEETSERVEILNLDPAFAIALTAVTQDNVREQLNERFEGTLKRIAFYSEQGIRRDEMPQVLADLASIREALTDSEITVQIDAAIAHYQGVDLAAERVRPALRTTTHPVLYSDLFQSQFGNYLFNVLRLDFGPSLGSTNRGRPISDILSEKLPISIALGVMAVAMALLVGVPLGVLAAVNHNRPIDQASMFLAVVGRAVPNIILGPILIIIFAVKLKLFPVINPYVWLAGPQAGPGEYFLTAFLPVVTLGMGISATIARLTRASLLQVLNEDYIRTARAKGLREHSVVYGHALRNSLLPILTILGPLLAAVLTGTFVVEWVFAVPGLGDAFVTSVTTRDYNLLVSVTVLYSTFLVVANALVDVVYVWLDPRIRL